MLAKPHDELAGRNVRFMLMRMIMPVRNLRQAHLLTVSVERQVALMAIMDSLDQAIQRNDM